MRGPGRRNYPPRLRPQWSPDGLKVGFLRYVDGRVELWVGSAESGQTQAVTREQIIFGGFIPNPSLLYQSKDFCWSPDSRLLAYSSRKDGTANIWTITPDGAQATKVSANANPDLKLACPIWAPDGRRLVYLSESVRRKGGPPPTWNVWLTYPGQNKMIFQTSSILRLLGWGARDDQVFIASASYTMTNRAEPAAITVARLSLGSRAIQKVAQLSDTYLANTHLSPDGKSLAFVSRRNGQENIWLSSLTGGRSRQLTINNDPQVYFTTLTWSPDSRRIYYVGNHIGIES